MPEDRFWQLSFCWLDCVLQGCTDILRADFEDLEFGQSPDGPLPGLPQGDTAEVTGDVIKNGTGISLFYDPNENPPVIDLVTGGKPHNTPDYGIRFWGLRTIISEQPVVMVDTFDTGGRRACGLRIAGGEFRLVSRAGTETIGTYGFHGTIFHDVLMRLDRTNEQCFLIIHQAGQDNINASGRLIDNGFGDLDRLRFTYQPSSTTGVEQYFIDNVWITKRSQ